MDHTMLLTAFQKSIFGKFNVVWFKKLDAHSLEMTLEEFGSKNVIWTYYNDTSWKLETK